MSLRRKRGRDRAAAQSPGGTADPGGSSSAHASAGTQSWGSSIGHWVQVVTRAEAGRGDCSGFLSALSSVARIAAAEPSYPLLTLAFSDVAEDQSVLEVPEIVSWFGELRRQAPVAPYVVTPVGIQLFFAANCGEVRHGLGFELDSGATVELLMETYANGNDYFAALLPAPQAGTRPTVLEDADLRISHAVSSLLDGVWLPDLAS